MHWLRKNQNIILMTVIGGFIISTFIGFGRYMGSGGGAGDTVLEVNSEKIPYRQFTNIYNRAVNARRDKGEELKPEALNQMKQEVLQSLVQESVFFQEAKRFNIEVSDTELAQSLAMIPAFQKNGKFDPQTYGQALHFALHTTPEDFEESQRRQIAINHLRNLVMASVKISDREAQQEFAFMAQTLQGEEKAKFLKEFSDINKFKDRLRQEKGSQVLNRWYQQLGTNLKIKVRLDEIERHQNRS